MISNSPNRRIGNQVLGTFLKPQSFTGAEAAGEICTMQPEMLQFCRARKNVQSPSGDRTARQTPGTRLPAFGGFSIGPGPSMTPRAEGEFFKRFDMLQYILDQIFLNKLHGAAISL